MAPPHTLYLKIDLIIYVNYSANGKRGSMARPLLGQRLKSKCGR